MPSQKRLPKEQDVSVSWGKLQKLHNALADDLIRLEASLPKHAEDMSEAVERYVRVVSGIIRSMDLLFQREEILKTKIGQKKQTKKEIIVELNTALDRIIAETKKAAPSGGAD